MDFKKIIILVSTVFMLSLLLLSCEGNTSTAEQQVTDIVKDATTAVEAAVTSDTNTEKIADAKVVSSETTTDETTSKKVDEEKKASAKETAKIEEVKPEKPERVKPKKRAKMHFPEKVHDYGFIMQGDTVRHDFYFKNVGNDDLLITKVKASCGCTIPLYPREPIPPGEEGKVSVMFKSAGKLGRQVPSIDVYTNYKRKFKLELKGFVDAERAKKPKVKIVEEEESASN